MSGLPRVRLCMCAQAARGGIRHAGEPAAWSSGASLGSLHGTDTDTLPCIATDSILATLLRRCFCWFQTSAASQGFPHSQATHPFILYVKIYSKSCNAPLVKRTSGMGGLGLGSLRSDLRHHCTTRHLKISRLPCCVGT